MPVSTPSYFPPDRAGDQIIGITAGQNYLGARCFLGGQSAGNNATITDFIAIGDLVASAGITNSAFDGITVIGSGALAQFTGGTPNVGGTNTVYGFNAANALQFGTGNIVIGDYAAAGMIGTQGVQSSSNVIIGSLACQGAANGAATDRIDQCVIIGANACTGYTSVTSMQPINSVLIGFNVCNQANETITGCTIIGAGSGVTAGNGGTAQNMTVVGAGVTTGNAPNCTAVGANIVLQGSHTVAIGQGITNCGSAYNTLLGDTTKAAGGLSDGSQFNVMIGCNAGQNEPAANSGNGVLIIEVGGPNQGSDNARLIYGQFPTGSLHAGLIFGQSGVNQGNEVIPAGSHNTISIPNGVAGGSGANVNGYFYVHLGALHWVGTSGTDTTLASA